MEYVGAWRLGALSTGGEFQAFLGNEFHWNIEENYPMKHEKPVGAAPAKTYPLNAWYAAAWDHEVIKKQPLARTICGRRLALFRKPDNSAAVLEDACWHRLLPLSLGKVDGENLVCGYHGLKFDGTSGRCTHIPGQTTISPAARVQTFPVVEKYRFVWVWPGDPALADPALVPDMHWHTDPAWAGDGVLSTVKCDYRLVVDNLLDLTHETFIHPTSVGNDAVADTPFDTTHTEKTVQSVRWMNDVEPPPFWAFQLGKTCNVDRWQIINFEAPSTLVIDVGVAPVGTGAPEGDRSQGVTGISLGTVTPESDTTCHYFWSFVRNYRLTEQGFTTSLTNNLRSIIGEDQAALEAQQQAIEDNPHRRVVNIAIDAGGMHARRIIDKMIAAEGAARHQSAAE